MEQQAAASATSLRSAKPTWAKTRTNVSAENRQRVIVFMAGGATYSESRACYDVGRKTGREIFLTTSHMLTPALFLRQIGDLSADKRRLGIPAEQPKQQAPAHLFEPDEVPKPTPPPQQQAQQPAQRAAPSGPRPPEQGMANLNVNGRPNGSGSATSQQQQQQYAQANSSAKLTKDRDREKEKKKHHFFGRKDKY
jgi:syntaxin-binding protein 1